MKTRSVIAGDNWATPPDLYNSLNKVSNKCGMHDSMIVIFQPNK